MSAAEELLAALRTQDRDRWLAALFVPEPARKAVVALAAFNWEIARIRETVSEPLLGQIRLQWWRDALDGIYAGTPRRHPVTEALAEAMRARALPRAAFERLIDARARDLDDAPFADFDALETYAEESAAPLLELAVAALGGEAQGAVARVARQIGKAHALAGMLAALPLQRARGQERLPAERFSYAEIVGRALGYLAAARALRADVPKGIRAAFLIGVIAEARLREIAKAKFDPFAVPGQSFGRAFRPLMLAWAAWRGRY